MVMVTNSGTTKSPLLSPIGSEGLLCLELAEGKVSAPKCAGNGYLNGATKSVVEMKASLRQLVLLFLLRRLPNNLGKPPELRGVKSIGRFWPHMHA